MSFPTNGDWLRCQFHAHTTNSDGEPTPTGLAEHYARAGYDVLAITDHHHVTVEEHRTLVMVPASELTARIDADREADILALGVADVPEPNGEFPSIAAAAEWIVARGGLAYLAHPYWSGLTPDDYLGATHLSGIEVFNAASELHQGNGLSAVHWDDILTRGGTCLALATDDSHYAGQDSRLGWTMVRAGERSSAGIVAALRDGAFYSTSGPTIASIVPIDGGVEVRCSPARAVTLRSGPWDGSRANADARTMSWRARVVERDAAGAIVAAWLDAPEYADWGRVEVLAADGSCAWSNPFAIAARPS